MNPDRTFYFAVKPGCEPVQVSGKTAHARFPWVAQGYEVFEWGWFEEYRVAVMLVCELDRLYEMCGIDKGAAPFNILNEANVIQDKVKALIAPLVAQEACAI